MTIVSAARRKIRNALKRFVPVEWNASPPWPSIGSYHIHFAALDTPGVVAVGAHTIGNVPAWSSFASPIASAPSAPAVVAPVALTQPLLVVASPDPALQIAICWLITACDGPFVASTPVA